MIGAGANCALGDHNQPKESTMTVIEKSKAAVAKIEAAKIAAERKVHLGSYAATIGAAVTNANRAFTAVTDVMIAATLDLASNKVFKGCKVADFDKMVRPVLKAAIEPLQTVGAGSKAGYITGCRNLFLARCNGIAPGTVNLTQAAWNAAIVNKLQAKGVLPAAVEGVKSKGRPKGTTGGKVNPSNGNQKPTTGKAGPAKVLTVEALQDALRLAGIGEYSEQLAHLIMNERATVIAWLDSTAQ